MLLDGLNTQRSTPGPLAKALMADKPEVVLATAFQPGFGQGVVSVQDKTDKTGFQFIDTNFFDALKGNEFQVGSFTFRTI